MNDSGERELVLGTKHILAIFFVVTVLCGVFFAIGYVVGGNSSKTSATTTAENNPAPSSNEGRREEPSAPRDEPRVPVDAAATAGSTPGPEPRLADNPAATGSQPPATTAAAAPAPAAPAPPTKQAPPADSPGMAVSAPAAGSSYLQAAALARPDAEKLVALLRGRDFPAILADGRQSGQFRVLVGPYHTAVLQADAKARLKALGFLDVFVYKP